MKLIGLLGNAGCGKDTVGGMLVGLCDGRPISLAQPLKDFASVVYGFTSEQLWGPSDKRNASDPRFDKSLRTEGELLREWGFASRQFDQYAMPWLKRILPLNMDYDLVLKILKTWFNDTKQPAQLSPRFVLQTLGTEFGRSVYPDTWIDYGLREANKLLNNRIELVVITDVRFLNEAKHIREAQGEVWHIVRANDAGAAAQQAGVQGHASEMEQLKPEMKQYVTEVLYNTGTLEELRMLVEGKLIQLQSKWTSNSS